MALYFQSENDFNLSDDEQAGYAMWVESCIEERGRNCGEITYIFCDDEYLLTINQKYLNHDDYTDIITFDYSQDTLISGDLFISTQRVQDNAKAFEVPFRQELSRVMIHGVLHLLGMEDSSPELKAEMRSSEDECLARLPSALGI